MLSSLRKELFLSHWGGNYFSLFFITPLEKFKQICNNKYMDREHGVNEMEDLRDLNNLENPCAIRNRTQWVVLSSNVSKLGSKEVIRHPERVSGSQTEIHSTTFHKKGRRKVAFTLAEVLITLGIIGVVAVLTLPSVVIKYREQATVAKLKQVYAILDQAFSQMTNDEGTIDTWDEGAARKQKIEELIPKYLKITKQCDINTTFKKCGYTTYKNRFNELTRGFYTYSNANYFLADGTIIYTAISNSSNLYNQCKMSKNFTNSSPFQSYTNSCGEVWVDINGTKPPNTMDFDLFYFYIVKDGIIPAGSKNETVWTETFENQCLGKHVYTSGNAHCTAWVIYNSNMDYLHCDDLSWDGKIKCK